jgi:SAM-dependent methyltransferase
MGAGEGGLGAWLAGRYAYTGVEPDDRSRARAEQRLRAVGRGRVIADRADLEGDQFDLVCAFEVLEHIEHDVEALEEWRARLRPTGRLLISVPAHEKQYGAADRAVGHYRRYEHGDLAVRLGKAGYEVEQFDSYGAGLGHVLHHARNVLVGRRTVAGESNDERSSASGRLLQPHARWAALATATVAAPFRVTQLPFARTEVGTGYVVLARRSP